MHKLVRQQVAWIWIAVLAILFGAIAPPLSHAMASAASATAADDAVQVCTMEGMKTVVLADTPADKSGSRFDPHRFQHFLEHCPYCALHASPALLPPPAPSVFTAPALAVLRAPLFYASAFPLFAWTSSSPRGPPAST